MASYKIVRVIQSNRVYYCVDKQFLWFFWRRLTYMPAPETVSWMKFDSKEEAVQYIKELMMKEKGTDVSETTVGYYDNIHDCND